MRLFVYGTLMQGFWNNRRLEGATFLANATVPGYIVSLGGFPGYKRLGKDEGDMSVLGELYEVDDVILARCDQLEGYRGPDDHYNFYNRIQVPCQGWLDEECVTQAFIYEWNGRENGHTVVPNGNWREYVNDDN